jgi:hypothetical protein
MGANSLEEALKDIEYTYYRDVNLTDLVEGAPKEPGIYYVVARLIEEDYTDNGVLFRNHNGATSNKARITIFGSPSAPIIQGNDGVTLVPSGSILGEGIYVNIFGSESELEKDAVVRYKYSFNNVTWSNYVDTIRITSEGTHTIYAKSYLVDNPVAESTVSQYTITIDKTSPALSDVEVPPHSDSVVIDVLVYGEDIEEVFITEESGYTPTKLDDWWYLGEV